ncbi:MAG: hypothetical protein LBR93_02820 [Treponema sp.]|jgi:hypothetical protein|nr:hypothetical protein [Treponema sp.]
MKRLVLVLSLWGITVSLFAQVQLPEYRFAAGSWLISGERLYQNNEKAGLAKVNIRVPQQGPMLYEFDARYESGGEDGHGGFGLHIFADSALNGPSWGAGNSYLLWLNYDENPGNTKIPKGLSAQVYRSRTNTWMDLVASFDLNYYVQNVAVEDLAYPVHFKIIADGNTGEVRVYDPVEPDTYYVFYLDKKDTPLRGEWVSLRTNGVRMSFTN